MKKTLFVGAMALAGLLLLPAETKASGIRISFGSGCSGNYYGVSYGGRRSYPAYSYGGYGRGVGYGNSWRGSSYRSYHAPVRRQSYYVVPGHHHHHHPHVHRSGHWGYHY